MEGFGRFLTSFVCFAPSFVGIYKVIGGRDAKFREQIWLTVTFANRCRG